MRKFNLTKEEKKINRDMAAGKYIPVADFEKEKAELERAAREHLERTTISIRVPLVDLNMVKSIAKEEGLPYQTLLNSIIHTFVREKTRQQK